MLDGFTPWPPDAAQRYRAAGYWRGETFDAMLRRVTSASGDRVAVVDSTRQVTYAELATEVAAVASALTRAGVQAGQTVVVQVANTVEFVTVLFGLHRAGAIPVLALPSHRKNEITHFCRISRASAYVVDLGCENGDLRAVAAAVTSDLPEVTVLPVEALGADPQAGPAPTAPSPTAETASSDVAVLLVSGGTTGLPKLIPRTHDDYLYNVRASAEVVALSRDDVYLVALPAAHNFSLSCPGILGVLDAAGTVVLAPNPAPDETFGLVERHRVTIVSLVPPAARLWAEAVDWSDEDLSSIRVLQVGGSRLMPEHSHQLRAAFGPVVQQVFGMAEGLLCFTGLDAPTDVVDSTQGRPLSPDDEVRVVDDDDVDVAPGTVGHLLTRGPYTLRGYFRAPEHNRTAFTADGFYRSGDLVRVTETGDVVVEGRAKDQINRGGEKIAAVEVEETLVAHPAVADVAVVAVPDDMLGERTCAFVVVDPEHEPVDRAQVAAFLAEKGLATFKIPDDVRVVDAFPVTAVGKTDKRALSAAASTSAARNGA